MIYYLILYVFDTSHRITEWLRLEGTSVAHLVQFPSSSRNTQIQLFGTISSQFFNILKEGDSHSKQVFPNVQREPANVSVCACCLWSCHGTPLCKGLLCSLCSFPLGINFLQASLWAFFLPGWAAPALSVISYREGIPVS